MLHPTFFYTHLFCRLGLAVRQSLDSVAVVQCIAAVRLFVYFRDDTGRCEPIVLDDPPDKEGQLAIGNGEG